MTRQVMGILRIADSDIALDARCLQEVVRLEANLAPRPLAPNWSLGTMLLRANPLPVVDLARLLGLESGDAPREAGDFVAVVSYRERRFGLRIDHIRDVVEVQPSQGFELTDGSGETHALTPRVLEIPLNDRPAYVLDLDALFALDGMVAVRERAGQTDARVMEATNRTAERWLMARRGETALALDTAVVREVVMCPAVEPPALTLSGYLGDVRVRDFTLALFDPCALIGIEPLRELPAYMVILDGPDGAIALAADRVVTLVEQNARPSAAGAGYSDAVAGVVATASGDALVIDHYRLLSTLNLTSLARLHAAISGRNAEAKARKLWRRFSYVHFSCDGEMSTPLDQLEAVANAPDEAEIETGAQLGRSVSMAKAYVGVWRFNERSATLVDLRLLLGRNADTPAAHVLLVDGGEGLVGFLVDSTRRIEYIEAPAESQSIRWRGDSRPDATPAERAKRLMSLGEGARRQVLALVCLQSLANDLLRETRSLALAS
ncbi:chemotaxis protein CheW [Salinicola halophilus]|uniref:chemotaxis protein CheW n=1 Tax=Salinicola halophilus TaxID=184065 RepID=UPI000DA252CD|nr:chemotaxis protein CheW [Salinicola halophilus]